MAVALEQKLTADPSLRRTVNTTITNVPIQLTAETIFISTVVNKCTATSNMIREFKLQILIYKTYAYRYVTTLQIRN